MAHRHAESALSALDLPGYEILQELGRGGVSTVYLARHRLLNRRVAIKVMSPVLAVEEGFNRRFIREGQTVAQLKHPGIVTVYDVAVADHRPYIAMEYLSGGSLKDRMEAPMPPEEAIGLLLSITESLGCAHRAGVFHRDVKPENILFRDNGDPVLTDFGIAKSDSQDTAFTSVGVVVGTPRYISPEQAQGHGSDARSDIYALGVMLYEMLTGEPPYDVKGSMSLLYAHINDPIPRLPEQLFGYQALLDDLMAKDPDERVPDCVSLASRLERLQSVGQQPKVHRKPEVPARRRRQPRRWPLALAAGGVLCVAVLLLWARGYQLPFKAASHRKENLKEVVSRLLTSGGETSSTPASALPHEASSSMSQSATPPKVASAAPTEAGSQDGSLNRVRNAVVEPLTNQAWEYGRATADDDQDAAEHMTDTVRAYEQAAEQGKAMSEFYLGVAYGNGDGVDRDEDRALYWLTRAANAGVRDAKYNLVLGKIFGSIPNTRQAAKLALDLAGQSYAPVYPILGWMYNTGTGVDSSFVQSIRWNMKTMVGDVTGRSGPPSRVVRQWEHKMQVALHKIRDTRPAQPDMIVR